MIDEDGSADSAGIWKCGGFVCTLQKMLLLKKSLHTKQYQCADRVASFRRLGAGLNLSSLALIALAKENC
jgi:hypothetical protein